MLMVFLARPFSSCPQEFLSR